LFEEVIKRNGKPGERGKKAFRKGNTSGEVLYFAASTGKSRSRRLSGKTASGTSRVRKDADKRAA